MSVKQAIARRSVVQVEDRRAVLLVAKVRPLRDVAQVPHEQFIRNALKDKMGWPRREPASESIKAAARELAMQLVARDKATGDRMAAREAAVAQDLADNV